MINPPAAPCNDLEPSKLILINPPCGFLHATQWVVFIWRVEAESFWCVGWNWCVNLWRIRLSTLACLALIKVKPGLGEVLRKTAPFLIFHILHNREIILSMWTLGLALQVVESICKTVSWGLNTRLALIQLWEIARFQQPCAMVQCKNRWSISSTSEWQKGHAGSTLNPLSDKVPLVGNDEWQSCQRKILSLGIISSFCSQLYSQTGLWTRSNPWAAQVTVLVEKLPLPDKPQHTKSGKSLWGSGITRINYRCTGSTRDASFAIFHSLASEIKWDTLKDVSMSE